MVVMVGSEWVVVLKEDERRRRRRRRKKINRLVGRGEAVLVVLTAATYEGRRGEKAAAVRG